MHLSFGLLLLSSFQQIAQAQTATGPGLYVNYRVNSASFRSLDAGGSLRWEENPAPTQFQRSISFALNHWVSYAGSRYVPNFLGETTQTQGTAGDYLIVARRGNRAPGDIATLAVNDQAARSITVFSVDLPDGGASSLRWTMLPRYGSSTFDLTATMIHEWGHTVLAGDGETGDGHIWSFAGTDLLRP